MAGQSKIHIAPTLLVCAGPAHFTVARYHCSIVCSCPQLHRRARLMCAPTAEMSVTTPPDELQLVTCHLCAAASPSGGSPCRRRTGSTPASRTAPAASSRPTATAIMATPAAAASSSRRP